MQGSGDEFLARAGSATDQDRDVGVREATDGAEYLLHRRGLADDLLGGFRRRERRRLLRFLRERLRALNVGRVTVKKRGSPLTPEDLIQQLRLTGAEERIVFLTHVLGAPYVLLAQAV